MVVICLTPTADLVNLLEIRRPSGFVSFQNESFANSDQTPSTQKRYRNAQVAGSNRLSQGRPDGVLQTPIGP
jgi:hypothetical protein